MATVVIPFAGADGKTRLHASRRTRRELSLAMLGDVLAAATAIGETIVVTADSEGEALARELGGRSAGDPGGGQGAAVEAALAGLDPGPILIVNADVPCVVPADLRAEGRIRSEEEYTHDVPFSHRSGARVENSCSTKTMTLRMIRYLTTGVIGSMPQPARRLV